MEFNELVSRRRSCRIFNGTAVTEAQLEAILSAAQWAPSPLNLQPFQFIIVTDPVIKAKIRDAGEAAKKAVLDKGGPEWVQKYAMDFVADAPLVVVVLCDPKKGGLGGYFEQPHGALQAASAGIQNMMLRATELGLDSLWFTFFSPNILRSILNIPDSLDVAGAILFGQPAADAKAPPRKLPVVHRERFIAKEKAGSS
jgi:5,6-dimethylbenzimidazole synthase